MRKTLFIMAFLLGCIGLSAQNYHINLHNNGSVTYDNDVNAINDIRFQGHQPANLLINAQNGTVNFPITQFDSITFVKQEEPPAGDTVYITYTGSNVNVINPFANDGVTVSSNSANVTVNSTMANVPYVISGSSSNGSLTISSNNSFHLTLNSLSLTSGSTAAINIATPSAATLQLRGNSTIADNANSAINGALYAAGNLTINGTGTLQVTGNAKHGMNVEGTLTVSSGTIRILDTDSDGIHGSSNLTWNGGTLDIVSAGSDGLDFSGTVTINNGDLTINTTTESQRSIKVTNIFTMTGGTLHLNITGNDCKGIKGDADIILSDGTIDLQVAGDGSNGISSDTDITVSGANVTMVSTALDGKCFKSDGTFHMSSGSIDLSHSGNTSKGIKTVGDITISGGTIVINSSGNTVVTNNDPAYCTAIKSDANVIISGGDITITLPTSNHGGKGISCAGNMNISGNNTIHIETHGDGATYTSSSGDDTYSSSCLRAEGNMQILSGNITLSSTGKAGKGIKVGTKTGNTYTGTYTQGNTDGTGPTLTISTTGTQVGSGGGGGWPPGPGGGSSNRSSAKAIKVGGIATINGGTTTITTSASGAEGLESKTRILINGGQHYFHCYDDCINSKGTITFEGGVTVCFSNGNDAVDSNAGTGGAITIGNGVVFAYTTKGSPEEGFDCDNNNYIRITGTGVGISAGGSQGGGGWPGGGGGSGGTISNPAQGYKFYTSSYNFQAGRYYTLSNTSGSGGTNMVTFSFEANCNSNLALITATGMVSGNTYYVKYSTEAPTNPTTAFHGLYLGGASSASTQAFSFTAQ
jgi:hypothetical protein